MSRADEGKLGPETASAVSGKESSALDRLEASRAHLRAAMQVYVQEASPSPDPARDAHRPLGQRLLDRVHRLPVVRTVLAVRSLRRR